MEVIVRTWQRTVKFLRFLGETARTLSALLGLLTFVGLGSLIFGLVKDAIPIIISGILLLVVVVLILIFLYSFVEDIMKKLNEHKTAAPTPPADVEYPSLPAPATGVELTLKEIVYQCFPDGQTMRMRRRFRLRALQDGVTRFTDRYKWTCAGDSDDCKCDVRSITPGFIVTNKRKEEFWDYFDVQFPHALHAGDQADFTIEWILFDRMKSSVPFLSTAIETDTQHLSLRVILPLELAPQRAYGYEFENYLDTLPIATEELQWDPATEAITYDVSEPKRNHKYLIRWYSN